MNYSFCFIIPVYNVEKYLHDCVDSILVQSYKNYRIVLVDDGSTDNSSYICDEYAKKNANVSVIHKKNAGLSAARNTGLITSKEDYIIFLDSDDLWIDKNGLNKINSELVKSKADVLLFNILKFNDKEKIIKKQNTSKNKFKNKNFTLEELLKHNIYKANANNKVIKKKIIEDNKMNFVEGLLSEDIDWCARIIKYSPSFSYLNETIYAYRQREGSITHSRSRKHIIDVLEQCEKALNLECNKRNNKLILSFYAYEYCTALGVFSINFSKDAELKNKIIKNLNILEYNISNKTKIIRLLFKIFGKKLSFLVIKIFMIIKE